MSTGPQAVDAQKAAHRLRVLARQYAETGGVEPEALARLLTMDVEAIARVLAGAPVAGQAKIDGMLRVIKAQQAEIKELKTRAIADRVTPMWNRAVSEGGGFKRPYYVYKFPPRTCVVCRRY